MVLELNGIRVNNTTNKKVEQNYYKNDEAFENAHEMTKKTPIFDNVVANISYNKASARDLTSKDILAKYIGGISGFKQVAGSSFESAFIKANADDFKGVGKIKKKDGTEVPLFQFDTTTSDCKVTMPSVEVDASGKEYWVIDGKKFHLDKETDTIVEIK